MNFTAKRISRFWAQVDKSADCWLWLGLRSSGYGVINVGPKKERAHRFSWCLENGPIPAGMVICHRCDVPACVRPSHLFIGTQQDNMLDCASKGRIRTGDRTGSNNPAARLTDEDVARMRDRYAVEPTVSITRLAKEFGVATSSAADIIRGASYPGAPGPTTTPSMRNPGNRTNRRGLGNAGRSSVPNGMRALR